MQCENEGLQIAHVFDKFQNQIIIKLINNRDDISDGVMIGLQIEDAIS